MDNIKIGVVLVNYDIEIDEKTIQGIIEMFEEFPEFAAMAPRMLDSYGNITPLRFLETSYKRFFLSCFIKDLDKKTEKFIKNYKANIKLQSFLPGSFLYYKHHHIYSKEALSLTIKHKNLDFVSEQYFFKKYLGASRFQMSYVRFFEKLYMCKHIVGHVIKKYLRKS